MNAKKIGWIAVFLIAIPAVLALVASIKWTGNVNDFNGQVYHCNDAECDAVGPKILDLVSENLFNDEDETRQGSKIVTRFDILSGQNDYHAAYFSKACYVPNGFIVETLGGGNFFKRQDITFNQKEACSSELVALELSDNEINIGDVLTVTTNVKSAFSSSNAAAGTPGFIPDELKEEHYSSLIKARFEVIDSNNNILAYEEKEVNLLLDDSQDVSFSWTANDDGDFKARIKTSVIDCTCLSSIDKMQESSFKVKAEDTTTTIPPTTIPPTTIPPTTIPPSTTIPSGGGGGGGAENTRFYITDVKIISGDVYAGDRVRLQVEISKNSDKLLDGIIIRANVFKLGIVKESEPFKLRERKETRILEFAIPKDAVAGNYVVRVDAEGKDFDDFQLARVTVKQAVARAVSPSSGIMAAVTGKAAKQPEAAGSIFSSRIFLMALMAALAFIIIYIILKL